MYFIVRVTSSQERITADILQNKIEKGTIPVYAIILAEGMRGYLILEAQDENAARELILDEPHVKGMLTKPLAEEELNRMLEVKKVVQEINVNDTIEFMSGPFKGYKAKVIKVEPTKEEITVELMDVAVPIPVTTKANIARIVQKAEKV
ncbi:MAG: transcription elongation factor Spt5 [Candidatus Micrarchaeota archaeon]|nr:transcription elongation factor Spt5 [Candidatus Micrarchaeota archaeon]